MSKISIKLNVKVAVSYQNETRGGHFEKKGIGMVEVLLFVSFIQKITEAFAYISSFLV